MTQNDLALFKRLAKDREQNALILAKPSMTGVEGSVTEKYSEQAHFIYELLQNADDVKATEVRFMLKSDGLLFIHNGSTKFNVSNPDAEIEKNIGHINAITSIGNSTKYETQIGKFGVGFKAVFQYTKTPHIFEDDFKFKIERFIVPVLIDNELFTDERKNNETLFWFPFDHPKKTPENAYSEIFEKLSNLSFPLLFINNLKKIEWKDEKQKIWKYTQTIKPIAQQQSDVQTTFSEVKISITSPLQTTKHEMLLVSRNLKEMPNLSCAVAFFVQDNKILSNKELPAFCFFPTTEITKLKFLIHAPFLLTDSRQGIKKYETWNQKLIQELAILAADSLELLKQYNYLNDSLFLAIPTNSDAYMFEKTFKPFYDEILKKLKSGALLFPTKEGQMVDYNSACITDTERLFDLLSSEQLKQLNIPNSLILSEMAGIRRKTPSLANYFFNEIGIKEISSETILKSVTATFIEKQTDEWLIQFYKILNERTDLWETARRKPIMLTENNKAIAPFNSKGELQIFLPYSDVEKAKKNKTQNEDVAQGEVKIAEVQTNEDKTYNIVKHSLVKNEIAKKFFINLKLREPDLKAEIEHRIFPLYNQNGGINTLPHFEIFYLYYKDCPQSEIVSYIEKLKKISFVYVLKSIENKGYRSIPTNVYFQTDDLKLYFENYEKPVNWLRENEYKQLFEKYGKPQIMNFLEQLGVKKYPKLYIEIHLTDYWKIYHYLKDINVRFDNSNLYHLFDYWIEGFENVIQKITFSKSILLWNILLYSSKLYGVCKYKYYKDYDYDFPAKYIRELQTSKWLYTTNDTENPKQPKEIALAELSEDYETNTPRAKEICKLLGFMSEDVELNQEEIRKYKKIIERVKDYTDEDFNELEKIKKRREIINYQSIVENNADTEPTAISSSKNIEAVQSDLKKIRREIANLKKSTTASAQLGDIETYLQKITEKLQKADEEFKEIETEKNRQERLYLSVMSLQEYASEMAHVVRTSFSRILRLTQFFKEEFPNPEFDDIFKVYAYEIHFEVSSLDKAVDFMLSYAKSNTDFEDFDIKKWIEYIFETNRIDLEKQGISTYMNISESLTVNYNKAFFKDIIENLLSNSQKALVGTENKQIECIAQIEDNQYVIYFSDNGCGIDPEIRDKIFELYFSTTTKQGGTGVGLFIVKTRINALKGTIQLVDNKLKPAGATFKISLPFKK